MNIIANRYEVVKTRAGGMGVVYLCLDRQEDRPVALKTFRPEYLSDRAARDLFLQEATIWIELGRHLHLVRAYDVKRIGDGCEIYLVMEWVAEAEGKRDASLRAWLTPGQPVPPDQALRFALHIARGMVYATTKRPNLVHRDLHPGNLLVGRDGYLRVTDFGLAGIISGWAGSPEYASPEQCYKALLDQRSDIYAFGCILYEMLTSRLPFRVPYQTQQERWERYSRCHIEETPPAVRTLVPTVPEPVEALVNGCLKKRPDARWPATWSDLEAVVMQLYGLLTGAEVPTEEVSDVDTQAERVAIGWSYNALGCSYLDISKWDVAVGYFQRVVQIGRAEQTRKLEGLGLCNLGNTYDSLGDFRRAIGFHEQALTIAREVRDRVLEAIALSGSGNAYAGLGELRQAISFHERALTIAGETKDRSGEGRALGGLGNAYADLDEPHQAIRCFEQAVAIMQEIGDGVLLGAALVGLGNTYADLSNFRQAIRCFEQAVAIMQEIGDQRWVARIHFALAVSLAAEGRQVEALRYAESASQSFTEIGYAQYAQEAQQLLAHLRGQRQ